MRRKILDSWPSAPAVAPMRPMGIEGISDYRAVSYWLMSSYAYYFLDNAFLTDEQFDHLGKRIAAKYDTIVHQHLHLIDKNMTKSGYYIRDYPRIVMGATHSLLRKLQDEAGSEAEA